MNFGEFIVKKRVEKDMTMRWLANVLEIAPSYLSDIEKGKRNPPEKLIKKISEIMGINPSELYDLAAAEKNDIPYDIKLIILDNPNKEHLYKSIRERSFERAIRAFL